MSPTPKQHQKTAALRVRLSEQVMAALKRKSRQRGCSVSDFVRSLIASYDT
jgi:predicted DNA binding CopG/RHH family protein